MSFTTLLSIGSTGKKITVFHPLCSVDGYSIYVKVNLVGKVFINYFTEVLLSPYPEKKAVLNTICKKINKINLN
jgi:hypothetical protein